MAGAMAPPLPEISREELVSLLANTLDDWFCQGPVEVAVNDGKTHNLTLMFQCKTVPSMTIKQYLQRMVKYTGISGEALIMAMTHIARVFRHLPSFPVNILTIHRLVLVSLLVSAKFFDDTFLNNARFARVGGELNRLEVEFLFLIDFNLCVETDDYNNIYHALVMSKQDRVPENSGTPDTESRSAPPGGIPPNAPSPRSVGPSIPPHSQSNSLSAVAASAASGISQVMASLSIAMGEPALSVDQKTSDKLPLAQTEPQRKEEPQTTQAAAAGHKIAAALAPAQFTSITMSEATMSEAKSDAAEMGSGTAAAVGAASAAVGAASAVDTWAAVGAASAVGTSAAVDAAPPSALRAISASLRAISASLMAVADRVELAGSSGSSQSLVAAEVPPSSFAAISTVVPPSSVTAASSRGVAAASETPSKSGVATGAAGAAASAD